MLHPFIVATSICLFWGGSVKIDLQKLIPLGEVILEKDHVVSHLRRMDPLDLTW